MADNIRYKLKSGKPNKLLNFVTGYSKMIIPRMWYRERREKFIEKAKKRADYPYIKQRVDYYNKIHDTFELPAAGEFTRMKNWVRYRGQIAKYTREMFHTAYYLDQYDVSKWFSGKLRWAYCPGDVYFTPGEPTIVKSRLLVKNNQNSVILKLDKLRHFMFVDDKKNFREKRDAAIFRGKIRQSRIRTKFLQMFFDHALFDCGVVGKNEGCPQKWMTSKKTIQEHLDYKFIMALEGNDVASNLKWVMSSNSIAVMTKPTCETWFMEGTLIPDYHYIEVKEDFSDMEEKLHYYMAHPEEAEQIIEHAHEYVAQFRQNDREEIIQILVAQKYFELSGQL